MEIIDVLQQIEQHLSRIAQALDTDRPAPKYTAPLSQYPGYDWAAIGAEVLEHDDNGATRVGWRHHIYTRRSNPKYGRGLWFSRGAGKDAAGDTQYERLITFSTAGAVEPLPAAIATGLTQPAPRTTTPATEEPTTPAAEPASELDRFFPRPGEQPTAPETARTRFFRLLPLAIAAGLAPDIANSLTTLGRRASYTEALTTLDQHVEQLEAATA